MLRYCRDAAAIHFAADDFIQTKARAAKDTRAFTGQLFCGDCGSVFYSKKSENSKGIYIYYQCGCRQRHGSDLCKNAITVREDLLLGSFTQAMTRVWDCTEEIIKAATLKAREISQSNREDAARLK